MVGIDSNTLTYFINATNSQLVPPNLPLEYKAIVQGYLYSGEPYILVPTVLQEYRRIPDVQKRKVHDIYRLVLFRNGPVNLDTGKVLQRRGHLLKKHKNGINDCQILAEAEESNLDCFITCDSNFLSKLSAETKKLSLLKPTQYLEKLNIQRGQKPKLMPDRSNPLYNMDWWKI